MGCQIGCHVCAKGFVADLGPGLLKPNSNHNLVGVGDCRMFVKLNLSWPFTTSVLWVVYYLLSTYYGHLFSPTFHIWKVKLIFLSSQGTDVHLGNIVVCNYKPRSPIKGLGTMFL